MGVYKYPCTRHISIKGFGEYLENESVSSRYNINKFAEELQERFGFPYVTLVNSGSSANLVAALAMAEKVKAAGKSMTAAVSAFTFPTTVSALVLAGFQLTIIDVDENSFNMSYQKLIASKEIPSVIAVTHFLGFPCDIENICTFAKYKGSFVLQDACETLGMKVNGKGVYEYGDITTLSFYHPHHMSSYGGGAVITNNKADYILADSLSHWGRSCKCHIDRHLCCVPNGPGHQFTYERVGVNVEISELNACFGRWQLKNWEQTETIRQRNYDLLYNLLKDKTGLRLWEKPDIGSSAFVFPIKLENGMNIRAAWQILSQESIEIRTLMGGVSNEQKAFGEILGTEIQPNAHEMADKTFFVGIHQTLSEEDVLFVGNKIKEKL